MWIAVLYLWTINALTLLAFGWDKLRARRGKRRFPEQKLLWLAVLGRWIFRHKTRKRRFSVWLFGIFGAQACVIYMIVGEPFSTL